MGKIHILSPDIVSKIAAGEVIERPAFAVKELIDNSIDAGATAIIISLSDSGLRKIVVHDNGVGMSTGDLKMCFLPHATSKIVEATDLVGIKSLGFRGEALSTIAAVADVKIQSRTSSTLAGMEILVKRGILQEATPLGMPVGTLVTIENIFAQVPARKKFLRTKRTELRHITEIVESFALAYHDIHFVVKHNKRIIRDFSKMDKRLGMESILGSVVSSQLLNLFFDEAYCSVAGFIGKPQTAARSANKQYIFVNKRRIFDRRIAQTVKDAYGSLLPGSANPAFVLFLSLPPEAVDVNIHPRKDQVSFIDPEMVSSAVRKAVSETLAQNNITFSVDLFADREEKTTVTETFAGQLLKETVLPWDFRDEIASATIMQIHDLYLVVPTKKGFLLVDQHAAHERILYEQFTEEFQRQKLQLKAYTLSQPKRLNLSLSERELVEDNEKELQSIGFTVQKHGEKYSLSTVPMILKDRRPDDIFLEVVADLSVGERGTLDQVHENLLRYLACRTAVKAGEKMTGEQAQRLVEKLESTANNATCPHGRPTKIFVPLEQLHRVFRRK